MGSGAAIMFDRLLRHAGLFEMGGDLTIPTFDIGGVNLGQGPRHAPMQVAPADEGKFGASDFAQAVVGEVVLGGAAAFDDTAAPEFVERLGNAGFVPIGGFLQKFKGE